MSIEELRIPTPLQPEQVSSQSRARSWLTAVPIAGLSVLLLYLLVRSRHWEYDHDTPLLQYCGFLMHRYGWMPYRDFFETSMPGTFLFHDALVTAFGTGNLPFMLVNECLLGFVLSTSYLWMRHLSRPGAILFVCWYGAFYLAAGPGELLQRDWLTILPIATAFAIVANTRAATLGTAFRVGLLVGMCACIKPQLAAAATPIVIGLHLLRDRVVAQTRAQALREFLLRTALPAAAGFTVPLAAVLAWLAYRGALDAFVAMVHEYLPLHIQQTGDHVFLSPAERLRYLAVHAVQLNNLWPMALAAAIGFVIIGRQFAAQPRNQLLFRLACSMLAIYAVEPVLSGQFWAYHYDPFQYWLVAVLSLLVVPILGDFRYFAMPGLLLLSSIGYSFTLHHEIRQHRAEHGIVADMTGAINKNVPAGVPVQPIDWTSGAVQALLRTQHPIGTRFLYDYHFYHHVQTPVIQKLRTEFVSQLIASRVPFVLEVRRGYKDVMTGINTSDRFDELDRVLTERYASVYEGESYRLLRLKPLTTPDSALTPAGSSETASCTRTPAETPANSPGGR
ncbi:MAG: hypothetical protein JSR66_30450 [Proteobacteria bacterium]|nr:hypothetical protein [Pseudomonadota bacterium]